MSYYLPVPVLRAETDPEMDYANSGNSVTGVSAPDFRVFIEGIEVGFSNIQIVHTYGKSPQASITMPYLPLLEEIGRGYNPKVYIFYKDYFLDMLQVHEHNKNPDKIAHPDSNEGLRHTLRLLFAGEISAASYAKQKTESGVQTYITFQCKHKSSVLEDIQIGFARFGLNEISTQVGAEVTASTGGLHDFNPMITSYKMLQGVDSKKAFNVSAPDSQMPVADDEGIMMSPIDLRSYAAQYRGVPGSVMRLWNGLCNDAYAFSHISDIMMQIYIPLLNNMKFFQTLTGHPIVEEAMESSRVEVEMTRGKNDTTSPSLAGKVYNPRQLLGDGIEDASGKEGKLDKAVQAIIAEATMQAVRAGWGQMPSSDSLKGIIERFLAPLFYDMINLASPVNRGYDDKKPDGTRGKARPPIETIVKPAMPMYYSPRCNVLYPSMYNSLQVSDNYDMPTRSLTPVYSLAGASSLPQRLHFRSPHSVRAALAYRMAEEVTPSSVSKTVTYPADTAAKHEQGKGVTWVMGSTPSWIPYMLNWARVKDEDVAKGGGNSEASNALYRHILEYTDYQHGIRFAASRTGNVSGCFNPYIVVGYPMDIIDPSPDRPSYHALCTQVVHSISDGSISTSIGFSGAASYEQLYSMDFSMSLPWLSDLLGIKTGSDYDTTLRYISLIQEDDKRASDAKAAADRFYLEVLGVEAAMISELSSYKYEEPPEGAVPNPASAQNWRNSMAMARRSIQPMGSIEELGHKEFILKEEIRAAEASQSVVKENMSPPSLNNGEEVKVLRRRQMGYSMFLDYTDRTIEYNPKALSVLESAAVGRSAGPDVPVKVFSNLQLGWKGEVISDNWMEQFNRLEGGLRDKVYQYDSKLQAEFKTPPLLFHSIIAHESSFNPGVPNPKGKNSKSDTAIDGVVAIGLCQLFSVQWLDGDKVHGYTRNPNKKVKGYTWGEVSTDSFKNLNVGYQLLKGHLETAHRILGNLSSTAEAPPPSDTAVVNTAILLYGGYGNEEVTGWKKKIVDHLTSGRKRVKSFLATSAANSVANSVDTFPVSRFASSQDVNSNAALYLSKVLSFQSAASSRDPVTTGAGTTAPATILMPLAPASGKDKPKTLLEALNAASSGTLL